MALLLREFSHSQSRNLTIRLLDRLDKCFLVALQAEVDEAVGNMSESTGSTRSQIDWEEVDKIMGET